MTFPTQIDEATAKKIEIILKAACKDPRNHQSKDLQKVVRPEAMRLLKEVAGYSDDQLAALL